MSDTINSINSNTFKECNPKDTESLWNQMLIEQHRVKNNQHKLFAAAFIYYFHENPEAQLLIIGGVDRANEDDSLYGLAYSVFRIDTAYVHDIAKANNSTLKDGGCEMVSEDYQFNSEKFKENKLLVDINDIPKGLGELIVSDFIKYDSKCVYNLWNAASLVDGAVYGKHNLDELLHLCITPKESQLLKADIENMYLSISCTPRTIRHKAPAKTL